MRERDFEWFWESYALDLNKVKNFSDPSEILKVIAKDVWNEAIDCCSRKNKCLKFIDEGK